VPEDLPCLLLETCYLSHSEVRLEVQCKHEIIQNYQLLVINILLVPALSRLHGLRIENSWRRQFFALAQPLHNLRLVLSAAKQGLFLPDMPKGI